LVAYAAYCVALYYNEFLELWVSQYPPFNTLNNHAGAHAGEARKSEDPYSHLEDNKTPGYASAEVSDYQKETCNDEVPRPADANINAEREVNYYKPKEPRASEVII